MQIYYHFSEDSVLDCSLALISAICNLICERLLQIELEREMPYHMTFMPRGILLLCCYAVHNVGRASLLQGILNSCKHIIVYLQNLGV